MSIRQKFRTIFLVLIDILIIFTFIILWITLANYIIVNTNHPVKVKTQHPAITASTPLKISESLEPFVPDYFLPQISDGLAPIVYRIPTNQNIVFLGIDDGSYKDQSVIDLMKQNNIKASLFLAKSFISSNPDFFKKIIDNGSIIENHTISHDLKMIKNQDYEQQKNEICGMADYIAEKYGRRPTLYRPPGGEYNDIMRKAAADCGMEAIVIWIAKVDGGAMQYQKGHGLRPGDIVLMHFVTDFEKNIQAFVDAENAAGLHTELIEDSLFVE